MDKNQVTIGSPNPYLSKDTKTPMVSYVVTGSKEAIEQYKQDQEVKSEDEHGNPLFHTLERNAGKYGVSAILERAVTKEGKTIWFLDNSEEKQFESLMAGEDQITKEIFAKEKIAKARQFAKVLADNRKKNIEKLIAAQPAKL